MRGVVNRDMDEHGTHALVEHYNRWRQIYRYADQPEPNEPDWDNGRLYFRRGFPHPDWSALILAPTADGHVEVRHASTERRNTPAESSRALFSRVEDAGKYIVFETADLLRVALGLPSLEQRWRDAGLDDRVNKVLASDRKAKYELRSDDSAYFFAFSGGIQPYNHLLALSYDELDAVLLDGFPESVASRLDSEKAN